MSALEHNPILDPCDCQDCRFWRAMDPMLGKYRDSKERREHLHFIKCLRLVPDLETLEALVRGERVPKSRLDPSWAKAYGIS